MITEILEENSTIFTIKIGRNAIENWKLIDDASPDDVWFHLDSVLHDCKSYNKHFIHINMNKTVASPHVIISRPDPSIIIPKTLIYKCGILCKKYSSYRKETNINVIYTQIKNITKGKEIGSVNTLHTKKLLV
jgi:predicted ribosome quality control (RQC) complex YloA/Tae2 family protein